KVPPQATVLNALKYYDLMHKVSLSPLLQMVLDFLSVLGTSTDTERVFLRTHLMVSCLCQSMNEKSVQTATILDSWVMQH
ncbi:hypothetical protein C2E23DRAFT_722891, partial [Lenzites betulinus]